MKFKDSLTKEMVAELVSQTIDTDGWQIIEEMIDEKISSSEQRLLFIEPTNAVEITRQQERVKAFKGLKNEIKKLLNT